MLIFDEVGCAMATQLRTHFNYHSGNFIGIHVSVISFPPDGGGEFLLRREIQYRFADRIGIKTRS